MFFTKRARKALEHWVIVSAALCFLLAAFFPRATAAEHENRFRQFLFGVDYYPEQWDESLWETDAQRMQDAGVNAVRIAEFGWSVMEPFEGTYDFSLFDRAIEVLGRHGVKVILGTPTATPPKWLTHEYPEVLHVFADGKKANDQTRRHYCYNSTLYRKFSRQVVEAMASHYQDNPNVIGWQIDNEFNNENPECFSESCRGAFRVWLKSKYSSLDALNARWGTRFWSQFYTAWEQIDLPAPATSLHNPALMLDFKRFISDSVSSYMTEQIEIIRKYRPNDFITTNGAFPNIDFYRFSKPLDIFAEDNYPTFSDNPQYSVGSQLTTIRGFTGRFMVMEQLIGPAGQTYLLRTPQPGQVALWAFQTIAHGAEGVLHFRWRTARHGAEEYWSGVFDQDNIPKERYEQFKAEGKQIRALGPALLGSQIRSQVAVLNDYEASWVFDYQYLLRDANTGWAFSNLFQAASEQKFNLDIVGPDADFSNYKIIFAPRLVLMDAVLAEKIRAFVAGGGTFVLSAHSAVKDRDNAFTAQRLPALVGDFFGLTIGPTQSYPANAKTKNSIRMQDGTILPVNTLAEILQPTGATVAATWTGDFLHGRPALTENRSGKGTAAYYGSLFNLEASRALLARYAKRAGIEPLLKGVPAKIEVTCRSKGETNYYFLLNHEDRPVTVAPGPGFTDLLGGKPAPAQFVLAAYQYKVLEKINKAAAVKSVPASGDVPRGKQ